MNPGGFLEKATASERRPCPAMTLPERGPFSFPAPYHTTGIRLTNASDTGGTDSLWGNLYSYWQAINAHVDEPALLVLLGVDRQRGGAGPSLWRVDKATDQVSPLGPIFPPVHALSWATAEGWYWSATQPAILYATDATHLYRVDVAPRLTGGEATVRTVLDVADYRPGKLAWQWHTSADGTVHSATLKDGSTYQAEGSIVYVEGAPAPWREYPARGVHDECQVDKSGAWLLVKENLEAQRRPPRAMSGEDNLIYRVGRDDQPRVLLDQDGAAGHSDNGWGYMVAADNWHPQPSAFRLWLFDDTRGVWTAGARTPSARPIAARGLLCYHTPTWDAQLGHVSHCNARSGAPETQYVLGSGASRTSAPRNNEVVGFRLDGSLDVLVIAPVLTDLDAAGGGSDDYQKLPKGNCDLTGEYFLWTTNLGGARLDALLVKVPAHLLVGNGSATPSPPTTPTWTVTDPQGTVRRFVEVP